MQHTYTYVRGACTPPGKRAPLGRSTPPPPVCWPCLGEQYCTTYEAVGEVQLAVMTAEDFHACIDRAIVNKSNTAAGGGGTERRGDESSTATAEGDDSQNLTRRVNVLANRAGARWTSVAHENARIS